jgi:hypothetical protein
MGEPRSRPRAARRAGAGAARVRDHGRRVRRLGRWPRSPAAADGGLLPRQPPPHRRAHGRRRAGRRHLEPGRAEPGTPAARRRRRRPRALVAGGGRDRRPGARRPRQVGGRRRGLLRRGRRSPPVPRDAPGGAPAAAPLPGRTAGHLRPLRGRRPVRGPVAGALADLAGPQPRPARPAGGRARRRAAIPGRGGGGRSAAAEQRRGLRPPGDGLAGLHLAHVLAPRSRLPARERAGGARARARLDGRAGRRRGRGRLPVRRARQPEAGRLGAPHPAADGARQLRLAAGDRPARARRLVPPHLRRRVRLGDDRQRRRHEPARRRRGAGHQAVCSRRRLHRPHERLLRRLPVLAPSADRRESLPLHRRLLVLPGPQPAAAGREPADAQALQGLDRLADLPLVVEQETRRGTTPP